MSQIMNISAIVIDPAIQPREQMDEATILEYAGDMQAGEEFPPIVAFGTPERAWLADGFHRIEAAKRSGHTVIAVDLREGGRREAILYSVGANATHGLRRTNADKRRAVQVMLRDPEWAAWSDHEIARRCAVSAPFVGQLRAELGIVQAERKVERGGVIYTMQTEAIGSKDPDPSIEEEEGSVIGTNEDIEAEAFGAGYVQEAQKQAATEAVKKPLVMTPATPVQAPEPQRPVPVMTPAQPVPQKLEITKPEPASDKRDVVINIRVRYAETCELQAVTGTIGKVGEPGKLFSCTYGQLMTYLNEFMGGKHEASI